MRLTRRAVTHVLAPLTLGVLVYFVFRAPEVRLFAWAHALGLDAATAALRAATSALRAHVPQTLVGSIPDFAWAYAFGSALGIVWQSHQGWAARAWLTLGLAVTLSLELGQALRIIEGVFDWVDLIAMAGGYWLGAGGPLVPRATSATATR